MTPRSAHGATNPGQGLLFGAADDDTRAAAQGAAAILHGVSDPLAPADPAAPDDPLAVALAARLADWARAAGAAADAVDALHRAAPVAAPFIAQETIAHRLVSGILQARVQ